MRIPGPSLASLKKKGDRFATSVRLGVRDTVRETVATVGATTSAEDLLPLKRRWQARVDAELMPTLKQRWLEAANDQRVRLKNAAAAVTAAVVPADIPPVSEHLADLYLATARNRLVGIGDQVWWRMRDQLLAGQQAGEGVRDLQARLLTTTDLEAPRAESIARTEVVGATNRGTMAQMDAAQVTGTKTWVATMDDRTRPDHRDADGQSVGMSETFTVGGSAMDGPFDPNAPAEQVINCVIGSTQVDAPLIQMAMRSRYVGEIVVVRTAAGKTLAVTPNHPVLTARSWIPAEQLEMGDHVISGDIVRYLPTQYHEKRRPTQAAQVYEAATPAWMSDRLRERVHDFHGEGRQPEIHVVAEDRQLWADVQAASDEEVKKFGLALADYARLSSGSRDDAMLGLEPSGRWSFNHWLPTSRVRGQRVLSSLGEITLSRQKAVRLGAVPNRDTAFTQYTPDGAARYTQLSAQSERGFSLDVALDQIVSVHRRSFDGHVYNLSTTGGWYTANGIITRNCRCTVTYEIEEGSLTTEEPDAIEGSAGDFHLDGLHDQRSHGTPAGFDGDGNPVALAAESFQAEDQTGAMVALVPTDADLDRLVLDGSDAEPRDELHLTLYYLGEAATWPDDRRQALIAALDAMDLMAVPGIGFGAAWWNPDGEQPAWVLNVGEPPEASDVAPTDLEETRTRVAEAILLATSDMADHPVPPQHEPWAPHVCLAYSSEDLVADVAKRVGPLEFDRLRVAFAGQVTDIPLLYPA